MVQEYVEVVASVVRISLVLRAILVIVTQVRLSTNKRKSCQGTPAFGGLRVPVVHAAATSAGVRSFRAEWGL